jgi:hypothetical protein
MLIGCLPLFSLSAQQKRAFEPGGPESLILAGSVTQTRPEVQEVMTGLSFTMDAKGKLINQTGDVRKDTVEVPVYKVTLFVDEAGAREALKQFAGQNFYQLQRDGKLQDAVRKGAFPKLLVMRFSAPQKARAIRENLATALSKYPGGTGAEAGRFTSYMRKDFSADDEVEIRVSPDGTVRATVRGDVQREIVNAEFADALLSVWIMKTPYSVAELRSLIPTAPTP